MFYIFTALKCEASALTGLPGEVIVTGVGKRAEDCISGIDLKPEDRVLNVGICAGGEKGRGYLINRVISEETGRHFYPDILFDSRAEEMTVTTSSKVVTEVEKGMLYDMESSIICESVLKVIHPSNLVIYKVVSDSGNGFPSANEVTQLIRSHIEDIKELAGFLAEEEIKSYEFLGQQAAGEMRLTQYMRNELKDIEHYCVVSGRQNDLERLISRMRDEGRIPVKDKKAGREVLDEIYSYLR